MNSEKRYALISGASSGIGWEFTKLLAEKGYHTIMVSNQEKLLKEKCELIKAQYKVEAIPLYMDLSKPESAGKVFLFCKENGMEVEILINNAGFYVSGDVIQSDVEKIRNLIQLHITGLSLMCRFFGQEMQKRQRGYILNMSSLSGWMAYPKIALYASTKRYIRDFSLAIRYELIKHNVSVTVVTPGAINTNLYRLSPKYQSLALRLRIMMPPKVLAKKALKAMFNCKATLIPGFINRIAIPFLVIAPMRWVCLIEKKLDNVFMK
jgi:hypothetical protein